MSAKGRRKGPGSKKHVDVPDVYREMLAEAACSPVQKDQDGRSVKKRRVAGRVVQQVQAPAKPEVTDDESNPADLFEDVPSVGQHITQSQSEDSADSDVDWENVDFQTEAANGTDAVHAVKEPQGLSLVLDSQRRPRLEKSKKRAVTALEKKLRLEIHKMNICCLLTHVHSVLRKCIPKKIVSYLNPDESLSQFQRSRSFIDGLQEASDIFRGSFCKAARGMAKPHWKDPESSGNADIPDDIELPMEKEDFLDAARSMNGSRDTGAQVFCSMLRANGVDARLVCSLQPFQFRAVEKSATPQRQYAAVLPQMNDRQSTPEPNHPDSPTPIGSRGGQSRFDGEPHKPLGDGANRLPARSKAPKTPIRESKYPIYWVEAFNVSIQKWIPLDPLVTHTIAKPSRFEPPVGERENNLSYVIAFEDNSTARDVTRRYAKAYNAKTRRDRVESTKSGERWWKRVMKMFSGQRTDRDQVEEAELAGKEAAEPMPRNVQDFKDHPYYALERHLRRCEVIHPKREVGKVGGAGKGHNATVLEPIYRRRDVQHVQSVDKWFRQGREVKAGETALKHATPLRKQTRSPSPDEDLPDAEEAGTPLYSFNQTTLYRARSVEEGKVPKNQYGNLDVYLPSMIPAGGAHIQHSAAARAAKTLAVDFADAVTGFKFSGRHGTAVTNGAIVAAEYVEAVKEVIVALEDEKAMVEQEKRSKQATAMWRRFMIGLRIRERIEGYDIEGEKDTVREPEAPAAMDMEKEDAGGGFLPDPHAVLISEPTNATLKPVDQADIVVEEIFASGIPQRPIPIIPVTYGPPIEVIEPLPNDKGKARAISRQEGLFSDRSSNNEAGGFSLDDQDNSADAEDDAIQLAIAQSLATENPAPSPVAAPNPNPGSAQGEQDESQATRTVGDRERQDDVAGICEADTGNAGEGNQESDAGSLLSHDPEEEEEDWPSEPEEDVF